MHESAANETKKTFRDGHQPLTRNQIRGFWASWGGWTLDGMDSFVYALVLVPSLRDLLPRSGIPPPAHADAHHRVLFGFPFPERVRHRRVAARHSAPAGRGWNWRRVGHGWHVRSGG